MSFDALIQKVKQAETALEAQERQTAADWRQLKASWRELWTPGRIVIAGLVSGFMVGRAEPFKRAAGGGALQLLSALSGGAVNWLDRHRVPRLLATFLMVGSSFSIRSIAAVRYFEAGV